MKQPDEAILAPVEAAIAESWRRAGDWIACRAGCAECCHAAFPITMEDARRLREGLTPLEPARAESLVARARAYAAAVRDTFPGDWSTGLLDDSEEWRDWFFARQKGRAPCPALDPARGECELYSHRPVACRIYGHLIQIGAQPEPAQCRLCFTGATAAQRDACRITVPEEAVDAASLDAGHTIVALALAGYPEERKECPSSSMEKSSKTR